jgi:phospholipid-translocating ATPase
MPGASKQEVRRRRSTHADDDDDENRTRDESNDAAQSVARAGPDPETDHRVRFSMDPVQRRKSKKRKSNEMDRDDDDEDAGLVDSTNGRSKASQRSAETALAHASGAIDTAGGSTAQSSRSGVATVLSPRSRIRRMSLRSSFLTRNMISRAPAAIELQDVGSLSESRGAAPRPQTGKKNAKTSVTITPTRESWDKSAVKPPNSLPGSSVLPHYKQWAAKQARMRLPLKRVKLAYDKAYQFFMRIQEIPPSKDGRHIPLEPARESPLIDERTGKPYVSNLIRSSKYNAWNFLPRQLCAQFSKLANAYVRPQSIPSPASVSRTGLVCAISALLSFRSRGTDD